MTRDEWLMAGQYVLDMEGPYHFRAYEIADVGRVAPQRGATLQAPAPEHMQNALTLIDEALEWIRWYQGPAPIHVNSWYRNENYNRAVGGADRSMHLVAGAADINKDGWEPKRLALALHNDHPNSDKLGIGLYTSFVHVDIRGFIGRRSPARWGPVGNWWEAAA